jgi:hypothetical protein
MRRKLATLIAISLLALPPAAAPVSAAGGVPAVVDSNVLSQVTSGPIVATGVLRSGSGAPTSGTVAVIAWPNETYNRSTQSDVVPTPTVGWTTAGSDGSFTLRVDQSRISSQYVNPNGQVNFEAVGWNATSQGYLSFPRDPNAFASAPSYDVVLDQPIYPSQGGYCYYKKVSESNVWVVIGQSWPYGTDKGWMKSVSSHGVVVGVGFSTTGNYGDWTQSGTSSQSSGVTFTWPESVAYRDFRVQHLYRKFHLLCDTGPAPDWKERDAYGTGGFTTTSLGAPPTMTNCAPVSMGLWERDSSSGKHTVLSSGVKILGVIGIDMSMDTNYASTRVLSYRLVSTGKVCGDNAAPALASRVKTGR